MMTTQKISAYIRKRRNVFQLGLAIPSLLCLLFAILWLATKNTSWEPWTVLTAALVAVGQLLMTFAENTLPKAIRDMDIDEIKSVIVHSNPQSDWRRIDTIISINYSFKKDPNLRIVHSYGDDGIQNSDFQEPWANKYPHPKATGYFYGVYYGTALLEQVILVMVDGGRADLPLPDRSTLMTDEFTYAIARIKDGMNTLEKYMQWAGISVADFPSN